MHGAQQIITQSPSQHNKSPSPHNHPKFTSLATLTTPKLSSSLDSPLRPRSQSFPHSLYPPSLRAFRLSLSPRGLYSIIENERPSSADGPHWDAYSLAGGQMSPTLSASPFSTTSSWFPGSVQKHHLGRRDVIANIKAFEVLAKASREYEDAIRKMSETSMRFAEALEQFSKAKDLNPAEEEGEGESDLVEGLRSLSGYQFYMGSQQRVLAQLIHDQCVSPLQAQCEAYRDALTAIHKLYSTELSVKTSALKNREKQHVSQTRHTHHNLDVYRRGLEDLTVQLDEIDQFKYEHYETIAEHTRKVWSSALKRTTMAARAQVDILEKVSDKGLQNDCLGRLIAGAGDPFDIVPVEIIDKIMRHMVIDRPLTPVNDPHKPVTTTAFRGSSGEEPNRNSHISVPTAPSPLLKQADPFEMIDDVPSVHEEEVEQVPYIGDSRVPCALTPLTPTTHTENGLGQLNKGTKQLLTRLGGYGWRG